MRHLIAAAALMSAALLSAPVWATPLEQATAIAKRYPLVDGHVDVPMRLFEKWEDVGVSAPGGNFDYPRATAGGLSAPFMSIYVPSDMEGAGARARADPLDGQLEGIGQEGPARVAAARPGGKGMPRRVGQAEVRTGAGTEGVRDLNNAEVVRQIRRQRRP